VTTQNKQGRVPVPLNVLRLVLRENLFRGPATVEQGQMSAEL
jgi:hypothetical protein